jgi:hypothetical protein
VSCATGDQLVGFVAVDHLCIVALMRSLLCEEACILTPIAAASTTLATSAYVVVTATTATILPLLLLSLSPQEGCRR